MPMVDEAHGFISQAFIVRQTRKAECDAAFAWEAPNLSLKELPPRQLGKYGALFCKVIADFHNPTIPAAGQRP